MAEGFEAADEVDVGLVVAVAVLVPEAGEGHEAGLDSGLFEHLPDHAVDQVLARMEGAARQLVEGRAARAPAPLVDHQQLFVLVDRDAARADVVGGIRRDEGVLDQAPGEHEIVLAAVVVLEPVAHCDRHQGRPVDVELEPHHLVPGLAPPV